MRKILLYISSIIISVPLYIHAQSQDTELQSSFQDMVLKQRAKIEIYPNPVESGSYLFLQFDSSFALCNIEQLYVYDETGFLLRRINFRNEPNFATRRVNLMELNPGRYFIRIVSEGTTDHFLSRQLKIE
jgi:hypothetical protein